jgi:hypothetical protein
MLLNCQPLLEDSDLSNYYDNFCCLPTDLSPSTEWSTGVYWTTFLSECADPESPEECEYVVSTPPQDDVVTIPLSPLDEGEITQESRYTNEVPTTSSYAGMSSGWQTVASPSLVVDPQMVPGRNIAAPYYEQTYHDTVLFHLKQQQSQMHQMQLRQFQCYQQHCQQQQLLMLQQQQQFHLQLQQQQLQQLQQAAMVHAVQNTVQNMVPNAQSPIFLPAQVSPVQTPVPSFSSQIPTPHVSPAQVSLAQAQPVPIQVPQQISYHAPVPVLPQEGFHPLQVPSLVMMSNPSSPVNFGEVELASHPVEVLSPLPNILSTLSVPPPEVQTGCSSSPMVVEPITYRLSAAPLSQTQSLPAPEIETSGGPSTSSAPFKFDNPPTFPTSPLASPLPQQAQVQVQTVEEGKCLSLEFVQKKEGEPQQVIRINAENVIPNPLKRSALSSVEGRRVKPKIMRPKVIPEKGQRQCQGKGKRSQSWTCGEKEKEGGGVWSKKARGEERQWTKTKLRFRLQPEEESPLWQRGTDGVHRTPAGVLRGAHTLGPR